MTKDDFDYASANAELERIIGNLQQDDLDIDLAMRDYERGLELIAQLEKYLKTAENKVTKLKAKSEA